MAAADVLEPCIPESEIRRAVEPQRRSDVVTTQKFSSHSLVDGIRSMDSVPAQVASGITTICLRQVDILKSNNSCVAASHLGIEVVVPSSSAARLQWLCHICTNHNRHQASTRYLTMKLAVEGLTVTSGICEHVDVDAMEVAVVELHARILGSQGDERFLKKCVVIACDSVYLLVTAPGVVTVWGVVWKQSEHGRNATQRRQVYHQHLATSECHNPLRIPFTSKLQLLELRLHVNKKFLAWNPTGMKFLQRGHCYSRFEVQSHPTYNNFQ